MGWQPQDGVPASGQAEGTLEHKPPSPAWIAAGVIGGLLLLFVVIANAGSANSTAGGAQSFYRPAINALPSNVQSLLNGDWGPNQSLSSPDVTTADTVESMVGDGSWIGSTSLPGTVTVGAPNAQGANVVTWQVGGQRFQWRISADGSSATPLNANANSALSGSLNN